MGFLSKVWKGIKKGVKKIGKGIKKVFKKVMKGIGKLGIVGQIGMMFLMPYAMQGLGSLFGTGGKLASWSTKLLGPNKGFFSKALGKSIEAINTAGSWVKGAYTNVSQAINGAIDKTGNWLKGRGFTSTDTLNQIGQGISNTDFTGAVGDNNFNLFDKEGNLIQNNKFSKDGLNLNAFKSENLVPKTTKLNFGDVGNLTKGIDLDHTNWLESLTTKDTSTIGSNLLDNVEIGDVSNFMPKQSEGLLTNLKKDIKEFDVYDWGKSKLSGAVTDGVFGGIKQEAYEMVAGEAPTPNYYNNTIPNIMNIGQDGQSMANRGYGATDMMFQQQGNSWQGTSMLTTSWMNDILNPQVDAYSSYMNSMVGDMNRSYGV